MGYCPIPRLGHDTADCIVTQQAWRAGDGPRYGQGSATTWPSMHHDMARSARDMAQRVRAGGLASEVCRNTILCIMTEGAARLRYDRLGCDTTPRHGQEGPRYGQPARRAHSLVGGSRDTKLYCGWGAALWVVIQRAAWSLGCIVRQARHDAGSAAIRRWRRATRHPARRYDERYGAQQQARARGDTGPRHGWARP